MKINVVTIFPEFFAAPLALSIPARAAAAGLVTYSITDLRDHTHDRHRTVDDAPYGGGPGMVMKPEPFFEAIDALRPAGPIVLMSARGRRFSQADAIRFAAGEELTFLCGHYKDVDQRVADHLATEELSLGEFVLSGGEPAALAMIDATVRLLPGAMSDHDSAYTDSFWERGLSAPSYTRPPLYRGHGVPEVLLSGDHGKIAEWRRREGERLTQQRRARDAGGGGQGAVIVAEPFATAVLLTAFGGLLAASVGLSRISARLGLPVALLFLLVGVVAGSEGLGHIAFEDYGFAFRVGTTALALILFDGGLNTPASHAREVVAPAALLATAGVVGTAGLVAVAAHLFGLSWPMAMLLGAIVSSTDAAAVFSVLSASGTRLRRRVGLTLELESGLNDPMAVILTSALTAGIARGVMPSAVTLTLDVLRELAIGAVAGYGIARAGRLLLLRVHLPAAGLYPAFTLALACLAFGLTTLLHGSGFLAVYVAGVTLGSGTLPHAVGIRRVHDALGWLSQVLMFLLLGLLVFPSRLWQVAVVGLTLALFLAFVARPVVAMLCLAPFRYRWRDSAYVGWVGLRGAVPIVLATIPVMADVPGARVLFDIVFFIVVVGAVVPGATVPWMARLLRVESESPPPPATMIEVDARAPLGDELRAYFVSDQLAVAGATLAEIPFPEGAAVSMLERGGALIAPSGATRIQPGDYVYVIAPAEHRPLVELLFGRSEEH